MGKHIQIAVYCYGRSWRRRSHGRCTLPDSGPNAAALEVVALSEDAAAQVAAHHRNGGCCGRMNKQNVSVVLGGIDADRSNEEFTFLRGVEIIKNDSH